MIRLRIFGKPIRILGGEVAAGRIKVELRLLRVRGRAEVKEVSLHQRRGDLWCRTHMRGQEQPCAETIATLGDPSEPCELATRREVWDASTIVDEMLAVHLMRNVFAFDVELLREVDAMAGAELTPVDVIICAEDVESGRHGRVPPDVLRKHVRRWEVGVTRKMRAEFGELWCGQFPAEVRRAIDDAWDERERRICDLLRSVFQGPAA